MSEPHTEQGQIERARRLREHIERLKSGEAEPGPGSIKEQLEQRERELEQEEQKKTADNG